MSHTFVVVHRARDWAAFYPSERVKTFSDYLNGQAAGGISRARIINLCRNFSYLSEGYYCSLLAEARGHRVIPSVQTLSDLSKRSLYRLHVDDFSDSVYASLQQADVSQPVVLKSFFGASMDKRYQDLSEKLFEAFPCPILEITLRYRKQWEIAGLKPVSHTNLDEAEETFFATTLDEFSREVWRKPRGQKAARYDLAILHDPNEKLPPSDKGALKRFIRAGRERGIECELITQRDYLRLAEFDGLLIRATTNIDHYTYRFAKKAEREDLVAIDDSNSILRCTNKIYLADLFRTHKVPAPRTVVLYKDRPEQLPELERTLGFPLVVKIPDGQFSQGVEKARDLPELEAICKRLFQRSTLLLAQEFLYTDFDWRIGILDNRPLFACRYYMVRNHWQIYRHGKRTDSGGFDTLDPKDVPPAIIDAALRATRPIGDGFYGVDVKERDGKAFVIEVNDNPNIDHGIEDKHLGDELYLRIMDTLLKRMESRRGH
jgi:glutathione synthase/RimK-type ligase-like ATP-grasp enzyme